MIPLPKENNSRMIYVSGPVTGYPELNRPAFAGAAQAWYSRGWLPVNPMLNTDHDDAPWHDCLRYDLKLLLQCHSICMLPGWKNSRGACLEHTVAVSLGYKVYDAITGELIIEPPFLFQSDASTQAPVERSLLEIAQDLVSNDRQRNYDHPLDNFTRIAKVWSVVMKTDVSPEQVALCMMGLKIARESYKHTDDNLIDIVGYALCNDMVIRERERRQAT